MQQVQRASITQEQQLGFRMSQQQIQSLKLMSLPLADLREKIAEELERNPVLEVRREKTEVSLDAASSAGKKEEDDYFAATSDPGFIHYGSAADADAAQEFLEGAVSRPETLREHLLWQLRLQPIDAALRTVAELCIQNLDDDGFHIEPPELLVRESAAGSEALVPAALSLIQSLDPQGCGTHSYTEALCVQARLRFSKETALEVISLLGELQDIQRGKIAAVAEALGQSAQKIENLVALLKELSPFPGRQVSADSCRYVTPDLQVVRRGPRFSIILNNEEIPVLGVSPYFLDLSKTDGSKDARDFAKENVKEARWFIQSINKRNHTLLRVARAIVHFQAEFFKNGPKYIVPLTLRDIASELDLHETTVSRAANGKYMQTEWGIFELRHFFTNAITGAGSNGSTYSKAGVKEIIREIITAKDSPPALTDQAIANILAERGIKLARRTVAKYRSELDLDSSFHRLP